RLDQLCEPSLTAPSSCDSAGGDVSHIHSKRTAFPMQSMSCARTLTARAGDLAKPASRRYHEIDVRVTEPVARTSSTHPGDVAQLGERLVCNQEVGGSIPLVSTLKVV